VRSKQVREHACGRCRVSQCIVGVDQRNPKSVSDIDQPVRLLAVRVKTTRHPQGAEARAEIKPGSASCGALDETSIELRIVCSEHGAVEPFGQLIECGRHPGCIAQHRSGDAMDIGGPDALERPTQSDQRAPAVDLASIAFDDDGTDLQDSIASLGEARRFDVDHCEAGEWHNATLDSHTHRVGVRRRFDAVCEESDVSGSAGALGEAAAHADRCGHGKSSEVPFFFGLARPEAVLVVLASELLARFAHLAL